MKLLKKFFVLSSLGIVIPAVSTHGAIQFARGELAFTGTARVESDSNIFSNNTEQSDTIWTFGPGARFARQAGLTTLNIGAGYNIIRFSDVTTEDSEDPFANLNLSYIPSPKTSLGVTVNYQRNTRADETVLARVESDDFSFNSSFSHMYSDKLGYRINGSLAQRDQLNANYSSTDVITLGLDSLYEYSPKLFAVGGFTYGTNRSSGTPGNRVAADGDDFGVSVGFEGEISPKITGQIRMGYNWRSFDDPTIGEDSGYTMDTNINWSAGAGVSVNLFASRGFSITPSDQSLVLRQVGLTVNGEFLTKGSISGSFSHERSEYSDSGVIIARGDNAIVFAGRLGWELSDYASVEAGVNYRSNSSGLELANYQRLGWSLAAQFTY